MDRHQDRVGGQTGTAHRGVVGVDPFCRAHAFTVRARPATLEYYLSAAEWIAAGYRIWPGAGVPGGKAEYGSAGRGVVRQLYRFRRRLQIGGSIAARSWGA